MINRMIAAVQLQNGAHRRHSFAVSYSAAVQMRNGYHARTLKSERPDVRREGAPFIIAPTSAGDFQHEFCQITSASMHRHGRRPGGHTVARSRSGCAVRRRSKGCKRYDAIDCPGAGKDAGTDRRRKEKGRGRRQEKGRAAAASGQACCPAAASRKACGSPAARREACCAAAAGCKATHTACRGSAAAAATPGYSAAARRREAGNAAATSRCSATTGRAAGRRGQTGSARCCARNTHATGFTRRKPWPPWPGTASRWTTGRTARWAARSRWSGPARHAAAGRDCSKHPTGPNRGTGDAPRCACANRCTGSTADRTCAKRRTAGRPQCAGRSRHGGATAAHDRAQLK